MSQDQIRILGTFMFPGRLDQFLKIYNQATEKPYGYLVIDAKQNTPIDQRFKTDIFGDYAPPPLDGAIFHCDDWRYRHENKTIFDKDIYGKGLTTPISHHITPQKSTDDQNTEDTRNDETGSINTEYSEPISHLLTGHRTNNMDTYPCSECGAVYNTPETLYKHIKQCGGNGDEDPEDVWTRMLNEVYEENEDDFNEKVKEYEEYDDAKERARVDMRDVYKKDLKAIFKRYFAFAHLLEKSEMYNIILEDFNSLRLEKQYPKEKALRAAIRKNDAIFDQVLDEHETESEATDDEDMDL